MKKNILLIALSVVIGASAAWAQAELDQELVKKTKQVAITLKVSEPQADDPVSLDATVVWAESKEQFALIMKVNIFHEWSIYSFVPEDQPYIQSQIELKLPQNVTAISNWQKPEAKPYEHGIEVYSNELLFTRFFRFEGQMQPKDSLHCGLFYQACDLSMCFPPKTKMVKLDFQVKD